MQGEYLARTHHTEIIRHRDTLNLTSCHLEALKLSIFPVGQSLPRMSRLVRAPSLSQDALIQDQPWAKSLGSQWTRPTAGHFMLDYPWGVRIFDTYPYHPIPDYLAWPQVAGYGSCSSEGCYSMLFVHRMMTYDLASIELRENCWYSWDPTRTHVYSMCFMPHTMPPGMKVLPGKENPTTVSTWCWMIL